MSMGKGSRRRAKKESRRRSRIAKACTRDAAPPTSILDVVPDDLLEFILLRVRTAVCLFRAAATCKSWRRVITGDGFLHDFRALHGPRLLLGHYCVQHTMEMEEDGTKRLNAGFFPWPRQPANHLRQRLSLDFLPRPPPFSYIHERVLTDSRGGLLTFVRDNCFAVVCDPLTRQYMEVRFPWGQDDVDLGRDCSYYCIGAFLLAANDEGRNGPLMSSFRVLCACLVKNYIDDTTETYACVFSARQNGWLLSSVIGGTHWTDGFRDPPDTYKRLMGRAGGSIFLSGVEGHVLVLHESTGEFSTFRLPGAPYDSVLYTKEHSSMNLRVVGGGSGGGAGAVRIIRLEDGYLEVLTWAHGAEECTVERRVGLCQLANMEAKPNMLWRFLDVTTAPAALLALGAFYPSSNFFFSLDVQTMKLQLLKKRTTWRAERVFPYELPWPQTITSACL